MTTFKPPRDNLVRAMADAFVVEPDGRTLFGRLARANEWTEINSKVEGRFLERNAPGSFKKTFQERTPKILFNHGKDPQLGNQIIAEPRELGEDEEGAYYRAEILEGVPQLIVSGLQRGLYGSSHTFSVVKEDPMVFPSKPSAHNPSMLPERTIRESAVMELGPVTWPAYLGAIAGVRSLTDEYAFTTLTDDAARLRDLVDYVDPSAALSVEAGAQPHSEPERRDEPETPPIEVTDTGERPVSNLTREEMGSRITELAAAIERQAIEYPGEMPPDAQAAYERDKAEYAEVSRHAAAWDARQADLEQIHRNRPDMQEPPFSPVASIGRKSQADIFDPAAAEHYRYRSTEQWAQAQRDNAMRAAEQAIFPQRTVKQDEARAGVQSLLDNLDTRDKQLARRILQTGSPIYRRAFNKMAAGLPLTAEEERGTSMVVTTDGNGGFAVPFAFDPTWIHTGAWTNINGVRANAKVVQITGTDTWQGTTVGAVTATRGAESTEQAEQGPTLTRPEILAGRVSAFVSYSIEMGQDMPGLGAELASLIAEAKDVEEEAVFTVGVGGANTCLGIAPAHGTSGMYTHINLGVDHTLAASDAYNVEAALPLRHRMGAVWFMNRAILRAFQALETTGGQLFGGQYYSAVSYPQNSVVGATGLELLRYPIIESPSMPSVYAGAGDDLKSMALLVNLKASYVIVDRIGMSVEFVPHLFHADGKLPIGARGLYALWRNGAEVINADGGRILTSTAA